MQGQDFIRSVRLKNFLSFGSKSEAVELKPLNVLIGPNASGKSNFIEAFRILSSIPQDPTRSIREGGGISEYLWKGKGPVPVATIEIILDDAIKGIPFRYRVSFTESYQTFRITEEIIEYDDPYYAEEKYSYPISGRGALKYKNPLYGQPNVEPANQPQYLTWEVAVDGNRSVLSMVRDQERYPTLFQLQTLFSHIQCYSALDTGSYSASRTPQKADLPTDILLEDASNLGLILNNFPQKIKQSIVERLKPVYDSVEEIQTRVIGGTVQLFIYERGLVQPTPALRLSEGMLRYLWLLTLLLHPTPPSLICLEEPEIGLHPDVIHTIAELLVEASKHTQIIVTTYSDILVSALANADATNSVMVFERDKR
jgi:predicted ATPase